MIDIHVPKEYHNTASVVCIRLVSGHGRGVKTKAIQNP